MFFSAGAARRRCFAITSTSTSASTSASASAREEEEEEGIPTLWEGDFARRVVLSSIVMDLHFA